jgi:hypothetical protein
MRKPPQGHENRITDAELRSELENGLKSPEIARKYGVSRQAISKRVNRLGLTTVAAAVAPEESRRFVRRQIDCMEELTRSLGRVNLLMDACDEWLRDPDNPERYDVGARSTEVTVHYIDYSGEKPVKTKAKLSELLARIGESGIDWTAAETKIADPRQLILSTAQEVRQTVSTAAELARMLVEMKSMEAFREALLAEIEMVDRDIAGRIAERVRRSLIFQDALERPGEMADARGRQGPNATTQP